MCCTAVAAHASILVEILESGMIDPNLKEHHLTATKMLVYLLCQFIDMLESQSTKSVGVATTKVGENSPFTEHLFFLGIGLVCPSVCWDSSEMDCRNFFTYISIRYGLGMMPVFLIVSIMTDITDIVTDITYPLTW